MAPPPAAAARLASTNGTSRRSPAMPKTQDPRADDAGRQKALTQAVSQIERAFGKGSIMKLDDDPSNIPPGISTGSISLD
ncbi:MAG: DNA recombination/repair protein RecA, partial [Planctomycetota bacterium]